MDSESELIRLVCQIIYKRRIRDGSYPRTWYVSIISLFTQFISLVRSLDLKSQPMREVTSLISQMISVAGSISVSEPEWELVSLVTRMISLISSVNPELDLEEELEPELELESVINKIFANLDYINWNSELGSLLSRIWSVVDYMDWGNSEPEAKGHLISLFPQLEVQQHVRGNFYVTKNLLWKREETGNCTMEHRKVLVLTRGAEITHFFCRNCKGEKHEDCKKAPHEVKHPLHPRHSLQLVLWRLFRVYDRKCYCCDEYLYKIFYYCRACDFAINVACVEKAPVLYVDHPRWHKHILTLFPRQTSILCNLCALPYSDSAFYICPPCEFAIHQNCITLPSVIKISRHIHRLSFTRLSFTPSFDQEYWSCGVCRKTIYKDYGFYSCIHDGCSYAAHSKCATQTNIWDGEELEGTPEDADQEEVEPFLTISTGIIQHFSHQQHHLRLDDNLDRDYDENKLCQACITPIYFGNLYSCIQCDFILHEKCANLSHKIQHPIHAHKLTLTVVSDRINTVSACSVCPWLCTDGFFYKCAKEGCHFKLHVQCATIFEPLVHGSHEHPLFLTSKPMERRRCSVCKNSGIGCFDTFNCIECNFALCFHCATLPQKVRYKHDKHMFTLSYGMETSTMTYWCEACEGKIDPKGRFYTCDESCSVMLHTKCLIGSDLYIKPGLLLMYSTGVKVEVLRNNHCMSRPICKVCKERCRYNLVLQCSGFIFCSMGCLLSGIGETVIK